MQGLFNRQHPFITSLFSKGSFATQKDIVTICCRRVVTSSRVALHHGKGVTFKLQGGREAGYVHNGHPPRIARGPANSKSYKTSSWLKKFKGSGSSCTITKSKKGKIIFRVTRQSRPKVIQEECTDKPSSTFRNSINNVFESKLVRTRRSKHGLNDSPLLDAKQPVDKLSLPNFKDTSIVNVGHRKTFKNTSFVNVMKKSRSAETQKVVKQNQDIAKSVEKNSAKNGGHFNSKTELNKKAGSYSDQHAVENVTVNVNDKYRLPDTYNDHSVSNSKKEASSLSSTCKKPTKARSKPLVFSSAETLFSNAEGSRNVGGTQMKKLNNFSEHELRKSHEYSLKDKAHTDNWLEENSSIQPLEESTYSTMKLFMGRNNNSDLVQKEGPRLSDTVKNFIKGENEEALHLECIGEKSVQSSKIDQSIGDFIPRVTDAKTEFKKVDHSDTSKSGGVNLNLFCEIASGDKPDPLTKAPLKSSQNRVVADMTSFANTATPRVQTLKKGDNITLHRHMDLKRQMKEKQVEFDTTVIEQEGKKITKIKPKHDSHLRRKGSNRSVGTKRSKVHLNDVTTNPNKGSTSSKYLAPEKGEKITLAEIDPFIPKMNVQSFNSTKVDETVIPADGRTIKEGDHDWSMKETKNGQNKDSGKLSLRPEGLVIPQDGNTIHPWETETEAFVSTSESLPNKKNPIGKSVSNLAVAENDVKHHYKPGPRIYGPMKSEEVSFGDSLTRTHRKPNGQVVDIKQSEDSPSMVSNGLGVSRHVFVDNIPISKGAIHSDHLSSIKESMQLKTETELAKRPPEAVFNGVTKPELAPSLTNMVGNRISSQTAVKSNEEEYVQIEHTGLNQMAEMMSKSGVPKQNVIFPRKEKKSLLPLYNMKKSTDLNKVSDKTGASFADIVTTVSDTAGISSLNDGNSQWNRKVTKIKFSPQAELKPSQIQNSSMSIAFSNQGMQLSAEPKIGVTSETATAIVLKSRIAQSPPQSVRLNSLQTQSVPSNYNQLYDTSITSHYKPAEASISSAVNISVPYKTASPSMNLGISNANCGSSSNDICNMPKASFPSPCNVCSNNPAMLSGNQGSCSTDGCNTKSVFPPPCNVCSNNPAMLSGNQGSCSTDGCNTKSVFPPPCNVCSNNPAMLRGNQGSCSTDGCSTKSVFPPPCNVCSDNPAMLRGNQVSCSTDGCNTKNVFPPPCNACETSNIRHPPEQTDCLSCPTCKPEFPPPSPSNPCSSTTQRAENSCYDPCNTVTKSRTHTVLDIDNLPRPPIPINIDCVPKKKPCFPPQCPEQCKSTPNNCQQMNNSCCQQMNKTKHSFAGWRAYMNYTYWSMKCLLTGIVQNFLILLKARIMHVCPKSVTCKTKRSCPRPIPPSEECQVMQSAVIRPKKALGLGKSGFNRNNKHVNSMLQQRHRTTPKNKVRKKVRIVKTVKKSVLDDRSKRAILEEEEKRKSVGAKANPALAYSEVLNIVFSQKKSV